MTYTVFPHCFSRADLIQRQETTAETIYSIFTFFHLNSSPCVTELGTTVTELRSNRPLNKIRRIKSGCLRCLTELANATNTKITANNIFLMSLTQGRKIKPYKKILIPQLATWGWHRKRVSPYSPVKIIKCAAQIRMATSCYKILLVSEANLAFHDSFAEGEFLYNLYFKLFKNLHACRASLRVWLFGLAG